MQLPKALYADCQNCPLSDRPCVPSYLPERAQMLVIGEAPGKDEVTAQRPFVGPSGQLLDHAAKLAGIEPSSIARTNAVLCRPEGNATPPYDAVVACSKRLAHEVNTAGVSVLVPMGNTALSAVDRLSHRTSNNTGTITARRGRWYDLAHYQVLPTFHPAYVLRNPGAMTQLVSDVQKVARAINPQHKATHKPFNTADVRYIPCDDTNKHRVIEYLNRMPDNAILAFDIETNGLQWYGTPSTTADEVLCLGMAWKANQVVIIPIDYLEAYTTEYEISVSFDASIYIAVKHAFKRGKPIAHNGKFDQHGLTQVDLHPQLYADTMLMHYVLNEEKGTHGLKNLVPEWLDCDDDYEQRLVHSWFEANKIKKEDRRYGLLPKENLYEYLAIDVAATLELYKRLQAALEAENLADWPYQNVLAPVANAIMHVEENGIKVDVPYLQKLGAYIDRKLAELEAPIIARVKADVLEWLAHGNIVVPRANWIKSRETYANCIARLRDDFNPGSWQQVQVYLYDVLKLKHTKDLGYKTDPRSTAEDALLSVWPNDTSGFVQQLLEYRRLEKIKGTYVNKLLLMADVNDRVHINYLIHGTEVNRLSATDAMHGIPRPGDVNPITGEKDIYGAAIRGSFIADDGNVLIIGDYSQAELRVFAAESGEPTMLEPYNNDEDLHDNTAVMIADGLADYFAHHFLDDHDGDWQATKACPICKEIRTTAKNVNFGEIYQGGAYGIWSMLGGKIPLKFVAAVLKIKRERQKVAANWKETQFRKARSQGFVQTRFGFMRRFPLIVEDNLDEIKKACVHFPIASGASILTLLSIVALDNAGVKVCGTWHDSIIAECAIEQAEYVAHLMQSTMQSLGERWYPEVKWKADIDRNKDGSFPTMWYGGRPSLD